MSILCLTMVFATVGIAPSALEDTAKKIENGLMAPCCMANTVALHESPVAHEMRREIRELLHAGESEAAILDHYVALHGEMILSMPRAQGFNLTVYWMPVLLLLLGAAGLTVLMRHWRTHPPRSAAVQTGVPLSNGDASRLERELRELD